MVHGNHANLHSNHANWFAIFKIVMSIRHVSHLVRHMSHLFQLGETCVSPFSIPGSNTGLRYLNVTRAAWTAMEIHKFQHPKSGSA